MKECKTDAGVNTERKPKEDPSALKVSTKCRYFFGTKDYNGGVECFVTFYAGNVVNMKEQVAVEILGEEFIMDKESFLIISKPAP